MKRIASFLVIALSAATASAQEEKKGLIEKAVNGVGDIVEGAGETVKDTGETILWWQQAWEFVKTNYHLVLPQEWYCWLVWAIFLYIVGRLPWPRSIKWKIIPSVIGGPAIMFWLQYNNIHHEAWFPWALAGATALLLAIMPPLWLIKVIRKFNEDIDDAWSTIQLFRPKVTSSETMEEETEEEEEDETSDVITKCGKCGANSFHLEQGICDQCGSTDGPTLTTSTSTSAPPKEKEEVGEIPATPNSHEEVFDLTWDKF